MKDDSFMNRPEHIQLHYFNTFADLLSYLTLYYYYENVPRLTTDDTIIEVMNSTKTLLEKTQFLFIDSIMFHIIHLV